MPHRRAIGFVATLAVVLGFAPAAQAAGLTITVTTRGDDSPGTTANCTASGTTASCTNLRDAIAEANANPGSTIKLPGSAQPYELTEGQLEIDQPVTIAGGGDHAGGSVIKQETIGSRVLYMNVDAGAFSISGVELTGGNVTVGDSDDGGGGLYVTGNDNTDVTLQGVAVVGNSVAAGSVGGSDTEGISDEGGGVYVYGYTDTVNLTVSRSTISGNSVTGGDGSTSLPADGGTGGLAAGGGIDFISGGTLAVTDNSTITGNTATGGSGGAATSPSIDGTGGEASGGGISAAGMVEVNGSTISGNHATGGSGGSHTGNAGGSGGDGVGGGVDYYNHVSADLAEDTISGNIASGGPGGTDAAAGSGGAGKGGGIDAEVTGMTVDSSTLADNKAIAGEPGGGAEGGGADANAGTTMLNSTVFANTVQAPTTPDNGLVGGGINFNGAGAATLASDTIVGNGATSAAGHGGNVRVGSSTTVNATDTIVAAGSASSGGNCAGTLSDLPPGHNLESDAAGQCGFSATDLDLVGRDPMLSPTLALNGGVTETLAPLAGSPVIGAGGACLDPTAPPGTRLTTDQRDKARGAVCDIGSFQGQPPAFAFRPEVTGHPEVGHPLTCNRIANTGDNIDLVLAIQWVRNGRPLGAAGPRYEVRTADQRKQLSCKVTMTTAYGSAVATSAAVKIPLTPSVTGAHESHRRWRESGKASRHKPPVGTSFTFKLNVAARVTLTFSQAGHGRRNAGGRCVAQTHANRHKPSCKLTVGRGTLTIRGKAGANRVKFSGTTSHGKLSPGSYTVKLTPAGSGGTSLRFTIV